MKLTVDFSNFANASKTVLKTATPLSRLWIEFCYNFFLSLMVYCYCMMYKKIHNKILLIIMYTLIHSSFCVLKSVLPACRINSAEVSRTTQTVEQAFPIACSVLSPAHKLLTKVSASNPLHCSSKERMVGVLNHSAVSLRCCLYMLFGLLHRKVQLKSVNLKFLPVHATKT
jgi:hypothetical protein